MAFKPLASLRMSRLSSSIPPAVMKRTRSRELEQPALAETGWMLIRALFLGTELKRMSQSVSGGAQWLVSATFSLSPSCLPGRRCPRHLFSSFLLTRVILKTLTDRGRATTLCLCGMGLPGKKAVFVLSYLRFQIFKIAVIAAYADKFAQWYPKKLVAYFLWWQT